MRGIRYPNHRKGPTWILLVVVLLAVIMWSALLFQMLSEKTQDVGQDLISDNPDAQKTLNQTIEAGWGSIELSTTIPYIIVFVTIIGLIVYGLRYY